MLTPLDIAKNIAEFLKKKFVEYDEKNYKIYAGFLPKVRSAEDAKKLTPAIVIRPLKITDDKSESFCDMVIFAVTFDDDMIFGSESLYHILEFVRCEILVSHESKWRLKVGSMETFIPDDQPYPLWEGRIDFAVNLPQPQFTQIPSWSANVS